MKEKNLTPQPNSLQVREFIGQLSRTSQVQKAKKRGRLIFAMDATASREPLWDRACHIQGQMFAVSDRLGGLDIQLCYYLGFEFFRATSWSSRAEQLLRQMTAVQCEAGYTQIQKVLEHALTETRKDKINAVVFIGDSMEENASRLCKLAGELGLLSVPLFIFHEGDDPQAKPVFQQMAKLSGGAYCRFDSASAQQLGELLNAVAVYAAGGRKALEEFSSGRGSEVLRLTSQLKRE